MSCFDPKTVLKVLKNHQPAEKRKEFEQQWVKEVISLYSRIYSQMINILSNYLGFGTGFKMANSTAEEKPTLSCWAASIRRGSGPVRGHSLPDDEDQPRGEVGRKDNSASLAA